MVGNCYNERWKRDAQSSMNPNVMVAPQVIENQMVEIKSKPESSKGSDEEN